MAHGMEFLDSERWWSPQVNKTQAKPLSKGFSKCNMNAFSHLSIHAAIYFTLNGVSDVFVNMTYYKKVLSLIELSISFIFKDYFIFAGGF